MNISDLLLPSIETTPATARLAMNILVQSTLILAAGLLAVRVFRHYGAAVQSTVLRATLVAVLACPAASWVLEAAGVSGYALEFPTERMESDVADWSIDQGAELPDAGNVTPFGERQVGPHGDASEELAVQTLDAAAPPRRFPPESFFTPATDAVTGVRVVTQPASHDGIRIPDSVWIYTVARVIWLLVAVALAVRLFVANLFVWQSRACATVADSNVALATQRLARAMGVHAPAIRVSSRIQSPCLVGVFRPMILLPAAMNGVSRDVLVHELAHLRRRDCWWQLLSRSMNAVFWFQPLSWRLSRRLEQTADDVADDFVVQSGGDRADYARQLVDIAQLYQTEWYASCVGAGIVSFESSLAKRVVRILDTTRELSTRTGVAAFVGIILLVGSYTLGVGLLGIAQSRGDEGAPDGKGAANAGGAMDVLPTADAARNEDVRLDAGKEKLTREADGTAATQPRENSARVIRGRVLDSDGRPTGGALIAVVALNVQPKPDTPDPSPWGQVLGEATASADGKFELRLDDVSSKTHLHPSLIARTEVSGFAWQRLDLDAAETNAKLVLPPQQLIQGRLVDIEGRPAAGLSINLSAITVTTDGPPSPDGVGIPNLKQPPQAWLPPITTDDRGNFTIPNIAPGHGVFLKIPGTETFAPQDLVLNTGMPEQRGEHDGTYRSLVKNIKPGEVATIALAPAQFFEGVVLLGDSGLPAANARITMWASQQEFAGSMVSIEGKTDAEGRFRLNPHPGVRFGIIAYPPQGSPYQVKRLNDLRWDSGDAPKQIEIRLDQGVLAQGTIVDAQTGQPLQGASVQYHPDRVNNKNLNSDLVTGWQSIQKTNEAGEFQITVLPGPGMLLVHAAGSYVLREMGSRELEQGKPGGARTYAHAFRQINPTVGERFDAMRIELQPGASVSGTLVDQQGNPIDRSFVISRLKILDHSPQWRGFPDEFLGGKFEISGLGEGEEYPVYFLDARKQLGGTATISSKSGSPTIVLVPCGSAKARFVDPEGQPVGSGRQLGLHMVVTPGKSKYDFQAIRNGETVADEDFVANIDQVNYRPAPTTNENGEITFPALIPGAQYRFINFVDGNPKISTEFTAKSGETFDMGDIEVQINP